MWELDCIKGWAPKNWCFQIVVLEKTLEGPLDCKELKVVSPKGDQPWIFIGRTDAEAEAPILWPPDEKRQLTVKHLMLGKTEGRGRRRRQRVRWLEGTTDSMDRNPSKLRDSEGQGAWCAALRGVAESQTGLNNWTTTTKQTKKE